MTDLTRFYEQFPGKRQLGYFTEEELTGLQGKLPDEVIEFLRKEGKCTFGNDVIWTVLPDAYYEMMEGWTLQEEDSARNLGPARQWLDPKKCHAFLRTSFGSIIYWHEPDYYSFKPFIGWNVVLGESFDFTINYQTGHLWEHIYWSELHEKAVAELPPLKDDEIYAFDSAFVKRGSPWTSKVVIVKMKDYLIYLAKRYKHTAVWFPETKYWKILTTKPKVSPFPKTKEQQPALTFKDINLKFAIIANLNEMGLYLEGGEYLRDQAERTEEYEEGDWGYMLPEVVKYYTDLYIPQEDLDKIVKFYAFGDCYSLMMKDWDGEDDVYYIKNLEGIEILRNMEEFEFFMMDDEAYQDITPLLLCPALKKVIFDGPAKLVNTEHVKRVFDQLREKGVEIALKTF